MNKPLRMVLPAIAVAIALLGQTLAPLAVHAANDKATYYGGTIPEFKDAKHPVEGRLQTSDETALWFLYPKEQKVSIPYDKFIDIEYGQKSGRRVGAAVASTVLLGPIGLLFLMSKKQKHYVTIGFKDAADKEQVAVFQVDKDAVRTLLPVLEARSGKKARTRMPKRKLPEARSKQRHPPKKLLEWLQSVGTGSGSDRIN